MNLITFIKSIFSGMSKVQVAEKALNNTLNVERQIKSKKWIFPVVTYALTLGTGLWLGALISKMQIHRARQLAEAAAMREKSILDSLNMQNMLHEQENTIFRQDETILHLRQQIRSDSIAHLSELEAIRAINAHLKSKR